MEIVNPEIEILLAHTAADKRFIDGFYRFKPDIVKSVNWQPGELNHSQQVEFEGSDDDIRGKFENYMNQLIASCHHEMNPGDLDGISSTGVAKTNYLADFNMAWVTSWRSTNNYRHWERAHVPEYVGMIL